MNIPSNKKLILISIFILILLATVYGFYEKTNQKHIVNSLTKTDSNTETTVPATVSSYHENSYTISYPNGWNQSKHDLTDKSGTILVLQPSNVNPQVYPYVTIETADAKLLPLSTMTQGFTVFDYMKTNTTVAGVTAQKYSTVIVTNEGTLHSIAYVFTSNGKNYMIKLGYKQNATDQELESQFMQIVDNFKLN